uniref:Uncharacterized protein n=1 Tax=Oryza barthii TaxID=65489 RepID=A0A0D3HQ96_9ORYZ
MAASALLSPVRPLAGTTRSGEIWGSTGRRRFPSVFPTKTREGSQRCGSTELLMKEKYRPYYPQAAVMCQLAASTLCKHTKNTALQRVVMVMIPQGVRLYIRKDSIAYCLPMQLSQARVFRSSTAPDKGNLFVYSSIDSCHVEKKKKKRKKNQSSGGIVLLLWHPCGVSKEDSPHPSLQQPLPVLSQQKVLVVVLVHLFPDCINDIWSQFQLLHACTVVPGLPLSVLLRALHQVCTLTGDGVEGIRPQNVLLQRQPQPTLPWGGGVQHVKQSREGGTIATIDDALDEHVWLHLADVTEGNIPGVWPIAEDTLVHQSTETPEVIHHKHLIRLDVQVLGTNLLPLCCYNSLESEWHAELIGTAAQAMPCRLNTLKWTKPRLGDVNDGDPHLWRPVFPAPQPAEQHQFVQQLASTSLLRPCIRHGS